MKRFLAIATALCFALPSIALAAPGDKGPPGKPPMTKPAFGAKPVGKPPPGNGNKPKPPPGNGSKPRPPGNGHKPRPPGNGHKPRPPGNRPPHRPPSWRPPGWHKPRPNQWYWRGAWVSRVRGPAYAYPPGYSYRYWTVGDLLPALFLSSAYYYDNVGPLGLEIPPPGYRWVRYGPDLLLVNLRTGAVEQTAYGVFY